VYRWVYIFTGLTFIVSAAFIIHLNNVFKSESEVLESKIKVLSEQQLTSQRLKVLASDLRYKQGSLMVVEGRVDDIVDRFEALLTQLNSLMPPTDFEEESPEISQVGLSSLQVAWEEALFELGRLQQQRTDVALHRMQSSCDRLLREGSSLVQDTLAAQRYNQEKRGRLMGVLISGLLCLVLLILWFLWTAMNSRREIVELNMMLERRVQERTEEVEKVNAFLFNVQASICSSLIVTDVQNRIVIWNPAAEKMWGLGRHQVEGESIFTVSPLARIKQFIAAFNQVGQSAQTVLIKELGFTGTDNAQRYGTASLVPLLGSLKEQFGVVILIDDITEMVLARQELGRRADEIVKTNQTLQRVNNDLEQFVYAASHDLRSPLVNMSGLSQKLNIACDKVRKDMGADSEERVRNVDQVLEHDIPKTLSRMNTSIGKFGSIIDGLLSYSRTGRQEYSKRDVDMDLEAAKVVELFATSIENKGVQILVGDLPGAYGDSDAINIVLANLLENALNYLSPERPGEIIIEGEQLGSGTCKYRVTDNGIGIAEQDLPRVFKIFERLKPEQSKGEGLGLALVKKIIERHDGEISVESEPSLGTSFWFTLPAAQSAVQTSSIYLD